MKKLTALLVGITLFIPIFLYSQSNIFFQENKGQWPSEVSFKSKINSGSIYFAENCFTYVFYSREDLSNIHVTAHKNDGTNIWNMKVRHHAYKVHFLNCKEKVNITGSDLRTEYYNYFIGKDPDKWAGEVKAFNKITYHNLYDNIDIDLYSSYNNFKYDLVIHRGADPGEIEMEYDGADNIFIEDGNLYIITSINEVIEQKPYAYQVAGGEKKTVECRYVLKDGNKISFQFPGGYDRNSDVIIDPVLIASTFTGSPGDTWGHCATYDNAGNIFAGGRMFNDGFPTTVGAYDVTYNGGVEVTITKYNPDGSNMIYSTYLGGSSGDIVHSIIANDNAELYVYGSTSSNDFAVLAGSYDNTYNGGDVDIFVTKFNAAGSAILGSTFVGGSDSDGLNVIIYNYSDDYRGEIVLDDNGNVYVASSSKSNNFPAPGAYDGTLNGGQDAVVFKLNSDLSALQWSTYLGGSGDDAGYGLRVDTNGDVYVVGGTTNNSFPSTAGVLNQNYLGGSHDGFVSHLTNNGSTLAQSTFFGTGSFDEVFFVDLDKNDNVYIYGLTQGNIPPTPGVYANNGSSQFITKLSPDLSTVIYSTLFGSGNITPINTFPETYSFSPTAFLVDYCENVYAAGWGYVTGYPLTADAIQSNTDGSSDFYLLVLKRDAEELYYATYYGDASGTWDHVDGGTSRFDKNGVVYQAVCG